MGEPIQVIIAAASGLIGAGLGAVASVSSIVISRRMDDKRKLVENRARTIVKLKGLQSVLGEQLIDSGATMINSSGYAVAVNVLRNTQSSDPRMIENYDRELVHWRSASRIAKDDVIASMREFHELIYSAMDIFQEVPGINETCEQLLRFTPFAIGSPPSKDLLLSNNAVWDAWQKQKTTDLVRYVATDFDSPTGAFIKLLRQAGMSQDAPVEDTRQDLRIVSLFKWAYLFVNMVIK